MSGSWSLHPVHSEAFAIHAALVHTGKVLYFGGDEYDSLNRDRQDYNHSCTFDAAGGTVTAVSSPTTDVFCCGQAKLADGRVLIAGGVADWSPRGLREAWIYDPEARDGGGQSAWTQVASMLASPSPGGRWYPTLLTLPDGRVLAAGGKMLNGADHTGLEAFSPYPTPWGAWTALGSPAAWPSGGPAYPRLFVLPGGRLFCSSGVGSGAQTIDTGAGVVVDVKAAPGLYAAKDTHNWRRTAVMLPLVPDAQGNYTQASVLVSDDVIAYRIDIDVTASVGAASWAQAGQRTMSVTRLHSETLLLPTGQVFQCCGVRQVSGNQYMDVMEPELYDPVTNTWTTLAAASVPRGYHSVGLLLPDGRVWTTGSSGVDLIDGGPSDPPAYRKEMRIEIFSPDYVNSPDRPSITDAPGAFLLGTNFTVRTPDTSVITKVRLLRAGATTHAFNSDQRCIEVPFAVVDGTTLTVTAPLDASVVIPGDYLLFLIGPQNTPSIGHWIRCTGERLFVVSDSKLWRRRRLGPGTGNDWDQGGDAYAVTAMASHQGGLLVASNGKLWRRGRVGPNTANDWADMGSNPGAPIAMASHLGTLYAVWSDQLWKLDSMVPGGANAWTSIGSAYAVEAMASHQGKLLVVSNGKLWRRNKLSPGTGNDWLESGASGASAQVAAMASSGESLYAIWGNRLYRRENVDPTTGGQPWTGPSWTDVGAANDVVGMAFHNALWG